MAKQDIQSKSHKTRKTAPDQALAGKPRKGLGGAPPLATALALPSAASNKIDEALIAATGTVAAGGIDTGIIEEDPKKQSWYRAPDSKTRTMWNKIAVMDAAGHPDKAIAKKLSTTEGTIQQARYIARKNGWMDDNGEAIDLELELALNIDRKIVRNISASLDGKMTNYQTHETTLKAASGRGIFKTHAVNQNENSAPMGMIGIQIIMPALGAGDQKMEIPESMCGGVPSYVDGEFTANTATAEPLAITEGSPTR